MPHEALHTITVEALTERVSQSLRDAIISGILRPGERLVEERIAAQLGVSRAPIREAMRVLEAEGLITSLPRRGVTVSVLTKRDVQEIYSLRTALECQAARAACTRITAEDLEELTALARSMRRSAQAEDRTSLAAQDLAFHQSLLKLSGNRRLMDAWLGIMSQVRLLQRYVLAADNPDPGAMTRRHEMIIDALRSRDPGTAERCLRDHIEQTAHNVFASFPESPHAEAAADRQTRAPRRPLPYWASNG